MYVYKYLYRNIDFIYLYNVYLCKTLTFERYFNAKIFIFTSIVNYCIKTVTI